ncbi:MAG TPA: hypothetical protein VGO93_14825 [Candidatus Xenobia bacterium]
MTTQETQQLIESLRREVEILRKALEMALPGYLKAAAENQPAS